MMNSDLVPNFFRQEMERILSTEKEYTDKNTKKLNSISILISAFFEGKFKKEIIEIIKCLKGFEAQTLLIDKILDNPLTKDKELRIVAGYILQATVTEKFYEVLERINLEKESRLILLNKWNETLKEVYLGQGIDVIYGLEKIKPINLKEYLFMIEKTTSPMILLPLYIGCIIKGLNKKETQQILNYGKYLGLAFQIKDDYEDFEKDILEGKKRVFVVQEYLDLLDEEEKKFILNNYEKNPQRCIQIINKSNIREKVINLNKIKANKSLKCLSGLSGSHINKLKHLSNLCKI